MIVGSSFRELQRPRSVVAKINPWLLMQLAGDTSQCLPDHVGGVIRGTSIADDPMVDDTLDRLQAAANDRRLVFDDHDKTDRLHVSSRSARRQRALFGGSSKTLFARRRQANGQLSGSWEGICVGGRAAREADGPVDPERERP